MHIPPGKKIFFLSDFHLGAPTREASLKREKKIVQFLDEIKSEAAEIFVVGDLFDFWYEYRTVVPKGYTRILGKLAELTDEGIPIHFFVGNHDMWMKGYFEEELNIPVYHEPHSFERNGKKILVGHGDGLGPGDHGYKFIKKIFRNKLCQWLFGVLPPAVGVGLANYLSRRSRAVTGASEEHFLGEENEWLIIYCKEVLQKEFFNYFIFGHRHLPIDFNLGKGSRYINLGDWIRYDTYAVLNGEDLVLNSYLNNAESKIIRK
ncbi:MAG: UDP-2,3-diacylglucosamine hydrolase [Bacteroidetes bacterium]|nr:MAG: UDP-2,3-diacylglucosamine hydrolase [Bacteroidota bacterium]